MTTDYKLRCDWHSPNYVHPRQISS